MKKIILSSLLYTIFNVLGMNPDNQSNNKALQLSQEKKTQQRLLPKKDNDRPNQIRLQSPSRWLLSKKIKEIYKPTLKAIPEDRSIEFPGILRFNPPRVRPSPRPKQESYWRDQQFCPNPRLPSAPIAIPLRKNK